MKELKLVKSKKNQISFTLYPAHSIVGRGNLILRHFATSGVYKYKKLLIISCYGHIINFQWKMQRIMKCQYGGCLRRTLHYY